MKIAIMQPYFLPYIGYWQLLSSVDKFIVYDRVNYIKGGWINRNRIIVNREPMYVTVPLHKSSPNKLIAEIKLHSLEQWRRKLCRTIRDSYRKSPYFSVVMPLIEDIIFFQSNDLVEYLVYQLRLLADFMSIKTKIVGDSSIYENDNLFGQDRIIDICKIESANTYVNLIGGINLYSRAKFEESRISLNFISRKPLPYSQFGSEFIDSLSIVDTLMHVGPDGIKEQLDSFDMISK